MAETDEMYLFEEADDIVEENEFDPQSGGKWMLFVSLSSMDSMWAKCCKMYRQRQLTGITSIKCSTAKINPKQSHHHNGVIIFHCGPADDKSRMMSYGKNIVEKLNYFTSSGSIPYKSDAQTALGTRRTGNTSNSLYWIQVPTERVSPTKENDDSSSSAQSSSDDSSSSADSSSDDDSSEDLPTKTTDRYWIPKKNYDIAEKYPCDRSKSGYWLMVFNKAWLDKKWLKACDLYEGGKLKGINSMRVSTAKQFEGKYKFTGTILCYCGPCDDLKLVASYGENLAKRMDYFDNKGKMSYRTDKPKKCLLQIEVQSP